MLLARHLWPIAIRFPRPFPGARLHRWALEALDQRRFTIADRLFEAAASRYRDDLVVEALARLRVHQRIARVRSVPCPDRDLVLETERLMSHLDFLESPDPPHRLVEAHVLLATWLEVGAEPSESRVAAA